MTDYVTLPQEWFTQIRAAKPQPESENNMHDATVSKRCLGTHPIQIKGAGDTPHKVHRIRATTSYGGGRIVRETLLLAVPEHESCGHQGCKMLLRRMSPELIRLHKQFLSKEDRYQRAAERPGASVEEKAENLGCAFAFGVAAQAVARQAGLPINSVGKAREPLDGIDIAEVAEAVEEKPRKRAARPVAREMPKPAQHA